MTWESPSKRVQFLAPIGCGHVVLWKQWTEYVKGQGWIDGQEIEPCEFCIKKWGTA